MTKKQAVALGESKWWQSKTARELAMFQLHEPLLCMPFDVFHKAVEEALQRPVFTHEFGLNWDGLKKELVTAKAGVAAPSATVAPMASRTRCKALATRECSARLAMETFISLG